MTNARRPGSPTAHPARLRRRLAWLPLLALAALALFLVQDAPQPAEAQGTPVTFVSNTGQTAQSSGWHAGQSVFAQGFTTGSNTGGYTLSSIAMTVFRNMPEAARNALRVEVWTDNPSGTLNTKHASLTVPAHPITAGTVSFAAPAGTTLMASTTYHLVIYTTSTIAQYNDSAVFSATASGSEDSGAATGWSIANTFGRASGNAPSSSQTFATAQDYTTDVILQFSVKGTAVSGSTPTTTTATTTPQMPTITLGTTNATVAESAGAVTISVSLNTAPTSNLTVSFARGNASTATATDDYTGLTSITINSGSDTGSTTVSIVDDSDVEGSETLVINASATGYTGDSLTLTITDNDTPAAPTVPVVTAGDGKLNVGWTAPTGVITGYQVHYTTAPSSGQGAVTNSETSTGSDHTMGWKVATRSATLTTASQEITGLANGTPVRVRVRDVSAAGSGAWLFTSGTPAVPTLPTITLSSSDSDGDLPEGDADSTVTITATLSANAGGSGVTVNLARANTSTAALNSDFTLSATSISISSGNNSGTVTLTVKGDQVDEDDETIILNATATGHTADSLTQTIKDDDDAGVTVSSSTLGVKATETNTYTVKLNSQPTGNVVITATSANTNTATVSPGERTFSTSTWSTPQSFTVTGVAAGTVNITHAVKTPGNTAGKYPTTLSIGAVAVTVSALPTIALTSSDTDGNLPEGNADSTYTITATLSANAPAGGVTVNLARATTSTAALTSDFTLSANSITIASGMNSGTVTLTVKGDQVDESNETIILNATATGHTGGSLTQTIVDNDSAGVTVSESTRTVEVGETTTYTVVLDSDPGGTVVITPTSTSTT